MTKSSWWNRFKEYLFLNLSITDPKAWDSSLWNLAGSQSLSGENVTEKTALTYSAVWNAVTLISGTIGALPLHLMQKRDKQKRVADNLPLYSLLHDRPNPFMTAMSFRELLVAHVLLWGNAFAEKVLDGMGKVVELWPISPDRVRPFIKDFQIFYEIKIQGGTSVILPRERVLHIPGLGFDGYVGYSVVAMARKSMGLGMALETFGSLYFGNGTHPGIIVSHPTSLSAQSHSNLKESLLESYSGLGKSHKLLLLEEGMKVEKVNIPNNDSQFLESRSFQIPEIARWFNLPPHKLKDLTRSSFNNIESEQISFVTDSILPWLVRLEQNFNNQLLTPSERSLSGYGSLYFKHNIEGLLRADATSRGNYYRAMFNIGALSINEIRSLEELDPIDGGDKHFIPLNMADLNNTEPAITGMGATEPKPPIITEGKVYELVQNRK
jgi:HK97 family phage portal protein